ncbi:MAG: TOBE domain-containing protein, partial [Planktomarina sp.]
KDGNTVMSGDTAAILADPASASFLGVRDPGTVVPISVGRHDPNTGLTQVTFDGGSLILPDVNRPQGKKIRLRIAAQDIILATHKPVGLSALNILEGIITQVHQNDGRGAMVQFQVGATKFLARVTRHSVQKMQLAAGKTVYAIVKATAFDPAGVGT